MDKNPIVNVEIHYHNHVDCAEILSLLNIIKLQNHKILEGLENERSLEKQMDSWLMRLNRSLSVLESVSDRVDSTKQVSK